MDISPGVERAQIAAQILAQVDGADQPSLCDWLLALIEDDEGKPAMLLARFGVELPDVRTLLQNSLQRADYLAPASDQLFVSGREKAINIRGETTLTTEFLMLAVIEASLPFRQQLEQLGISLVALENDLRPDYMVTEETFETTPQSLILNETPVDWETYRVIDVNCNRSRESLRILDDYARFVLNDRVLTESLKSLRHDMVGAIQPLRLDHLIGSRDTPQDVGVDLTTSTEYQRESLGNVALVNLKRLQESLRSAEEFAKIVNPTVSRSLEQLRYRAYTLESSLVRGQSARERLQNARLYALLTGAKCACTLDWTIAEAAEGGVGVFQLREKELPDRELLERAKRFRKWTRLAGVLFIMNDRADIARLAEADGVHLGQDDLSVSAARKLLGPEALIGVSTHNLEQVRRAVLDGADYLGIGPIFPSTTKEFSKLAGLEFVRQASAETTLPSFALGGITLQNLLQVRQAGATRIAVSAALCESDEPGLIANQLRLAMIAPLPEEVTPPAHPSPAGSDHQ